MVTNNSIAQQITNLPDKPGVYQFYSSKGEIIYVGKAKNLRNRVSSYFNRSHYDSAKLRVLVSKIVNIKHIVVDTESDALLLENNLIKKLQPRYNILLKDDKTYPWICITNEPFPRVFSTRRIESDGSKYFGPYTSGVVLKSMLDLVRSLYPLRTCTLNLTKENISKKRFKPCLEFQIGNCKAPCIANQSEEEYNENLSQIVDLLKGNIGSVKKELEKQMKQKAREYRFEEAQLLKNKIEALTRYQAKSSIVSQTLSDIDVFSVISEPSVAYVNYLKIIKGSVVQAHNVQIKKYIDESETELLATAISDIRQKVNSTAKEIVVPLLPEFSINGAKYVLPARGDKKSLLNLSERNVRAFAHAQKVAQEKRDSASRTSRILKTLQKDFRTKDLPVHIECFDNSNTQGTNPVSACVVFKNARPEKREYRLFNIKTVQGPNDYASMQEAVRRRYSRLIANSSPLPQLIVVDGGKGQLNAAYIVLKELGIEQEVQIVGIAERLEEIFFYGDPVPIYLDKNSESLKVIQHARNEAHRFGINHHRNKRSKNSIKSELSEIKGIGENSIVKLLKKFKSIDRLSKASYEEISAEIGGAKAKLIYNYYKTK
ncbi:MAG TPA: excinuclease ABC subunit C [Bacteroidetes bacterium]|nr:excinuclease ABC subunit C [Bacteroidota bacterium]